MPKIHKKKISSRFRYLAIGAIVVVLVVASSTWFYLHLTPSKHRNTYIPSTVIYAPATPQEKAETDQHKQDIVNNQGQSGSSAPPSTPASVTPIIVDANQYGNVVEVRGFVPQITESNGTCTYTFNGASTFTRQQAAVADATTTRCPALDLPTSLFAPGTWNTTITYISSAHTGTSESKSFEVK
jgi:hypothetical protein